MSRGRKSDKNVIYTVRGPRRAGRRFFPVAFSRFSIFTRNAYPFRTKSRQFRDAVRERPTGVEFRNVERDEIFELERGQLSRTLFKCPPSSNARRPEYENPLSFSINTHRGRLRTFRLRISL